MLRIKFCVYGLGNLKDTKKYTLSELTRLVAVAEMIKAKVKTEELTVLASMVGGIFGAKRR